MKVLVEAYGCALNRGEADEFKATLLAAGHSMTVVPEDADALAFFTCGVIETTERHMLKRIKVCPAGKPLLVCGCLPNICPDKVLRAAPHAMLVGPARHLEALKNLEAPNSPAVSGLRSSVGILPIATGCLGDCTYCITKHARGELRSRRIDELLRRLEELVASGAAEVQACAQDTAAWGADFGKGLAQLMDALGSADGDFMVRIGMMNPASVMPRLGELLDAFENPKVFKFLHLPVQSGSDAVLERMNRRHMADDFRKIVHSFRERFPGLALSTDIIVGFPGETESDFNESMELMEETKPDIINVTRFSPRPGTAAYNMKPKVPGRVAKERSRQLTELRFRLTRMNYSEMVGKQVRAVATERRVQGTTFLRTMDYRPVVVPGELELGRWYEVTITGAERTHLSGKYSVK